MKNVLILSGSPRKGGNSDVLCGEFMKGALEAGHQVEKNRVAEKKIGYCRARFRGYAECVEGAKEMGVIYGTGVYHKGEVQGHKAMRDAYEMGKGV